jgi:hypothetical protein
VVADSGTVTIRMTPGLAAALRAGLVRPAAVLAHAGGGETGIGKNAEGGNAGRDDSGGATRPERKWKQWRKYTGRGVLAESIDDDDEERTVKEVFLLGYAGRTPEEIRRIAEMVDATVVDIRWRAGSRHPQWAKSNLAKTLGPGRYVHVPALGNLNYKGERGPQIEIADFDAGRRALDRIAGSVILLCVCKDAATCHRTTVAGMLRAAGGYAIAEWDAHEHAHEPAQAALL